MKRTGHGLGDTSLFSALLVFSNVSSLHLTLDLSLQLACPVIRCLSNLLTEVAVEDVGGQMQLQDERVVAALFILLEFFLQKQPRLLPEGLWLLNNLTGMYHSLSIQIWPFILISSKY